MMVMCDCYFDGLVVCYDLHAIYGLSSYEDARHKWVHVSKKTKISELLAENLDFFIYFKKTNIEKVSPENLFRQASKTEIKTFALNLETCKFCSYTQLLPKILICMTRINTIKNLYVSQLVSGNEN